MEKWRHGDMETWTWRHQTEKGSLGIFLNPFTVCSSCKRISSFVCLLVRKQTEAIRLQTDYTDQTDLPIYDYKQSMFMYSTIDPPSQVAWISWLQPSPFR
jgi:hypothetical protein